MLLRILVTAGETLEHGCFSGPNSWTVSNTTPLIKKNSAKKCFSGKIMGIEYVDIFPGENLSSILVATSFIGQFVHSVGGEGMR